jgi:hypothetical protein
MASHRKLDSKISLFEIYQRPESSIGCLAVFTLTPYCDKLLDPDKYCSKNPESSIKHQEFPYFWAE